MRHRIRKMFTLRRNMKKESAVDLYSKKIEARQTEIQTAMSQLKKEMEPPTLKSLRGERRRPRSPPHFEKFPK